MKNKRVINVFNGMSSTSTSSFHKLISMHLVSCPYWKVWWMKATYTWASTDWRVRPSSTPSCRPRGPGWAPLSPACCHPGMERWGNAPTLYRGSGIEKKTCLLSIEMKAWAWFRLWPWVVMTLPANVVV